MLSDTLLRSYIVPFVKNWARGLMHPRPFAGLIHLPRYLKEWHTFVKQAGRGVSRFRDTYPCLADRIPHTPFDPHYFYQGAWLARRLARVVPSLHVDVGSDIRAVSVLSGTIDTVFVDYRPLQAALPNLLPLAADITRLPFRDGSIDSLSCLHVIEHVGLGRYGDILNPAGSSLAAEELRRVLKPGGKLYLSLPVGRERVCFNAHRVHAPLKVLEMFPDLDLETFSYVDDHGTFHCNHRPAEAASCAYACGMYEFIRKKRC